LVKVLLVGAVTLHSGVIPQKENEYGYNWVLC